MLEQPDIGSVAHAMILEEIWDVRRHTTAEKLMEALKFGERIGDEQITGAAYYRIMLWRSGSESPPLSMPYPFERLDNLNLENLQRGKERCIEEWSRILELWRETKEEQLYEWLAKTLLALIDGHFLSCDVVGKVEAGLTILTENRWRSDTWARKHTEVKAQLESIKSSIHDYFLPKAPPVAELDILVTETEAEELEDKLPWGVE